MSTGANPMTVTWVEVSLISALLGILLFVIGHLISHLVRSSLNDVKELHGQAMAKFDDLISSINDLKTQMAVHDQQLMAGSKEFARIEAHQKDQDKKISSIEREVFALKNGS